MSLVENRSKTGMFQENTYTGYTLVYLKPKIVIRNLNVYYGENHVLRNINITIPERAITAIMGPSGCGKTTLLRTMNRIIELVEEARVLGEVVIDDINIYSSKIRVTELRRKVGMVFQKPNPLPMSIYDNVAYGLRIHGLRDRKKIDAIVEKCLRSVGLWEEVKDRLHEPAARLSGGQQQRLCIARALATEPEILLLDEPTSSLDPVSADKIEKLLLELKEKYTIVVVTHNVHQAMRLADYVVFLYLGRVIEEGPADQVFTYPRNRLTRNFINGVIS